MNKSEIRTFIKKQREELARNWVEEHSRLVQERLVNLPELFKADIVGCYLAVGMEVETKLILKECWQAGKTVCVPAYNKAVGRYDLVRLEKGMHLEEGPFKVPQPIKREYVSGGEIGFMVVPGVAFDSSGGRIGHGGGYYDRILEGHRTACRMALAFEFQMLEQVPMEEHDVRMDMIVTEKHVVRISCKNSEVRIQNV
ncbi:5-formyltetrahydrofolate cyclo-ligase [Verrucomicrobiota bacterium]